MYPNIDRVLYIKNGKAEYDFVVRQGGRIEDIAISYKGAKEMLLNADGSLRLLTALGEVKESAPVCYGADGKKIEAGYALENGQLKFKAAKHSGELVIDPVLQWSTYYGGSGQEMGASYVCYDPAGYVYLAASTKSTNNIATVGSYQETRSQIGNNNATNAFIVKFDTNGVRQWATYYSGELNSSAENISIDGQGNIYVCGGTDCLTGMSTAGNHQTTKGPGTTSDAFVAKFTSAGTRIWSSYFGGEAADRAWGITYDSSGNIILTGQTQSEDSISSNGCHQPLYGNPGVQNAFDGFIAKFDTAGNFIWSTYYGGEKNDIVFSVQCDGTGNIYVCGNTKSTSGIATSGSYQSSYMSAFTNGDNAFLAKFDASGVRQWATYYGDTGIATARNLALHGNDITFVGSAGFNSDATTSGVYQSTYGGGQTNGLIARFSQSGQRQWGTYFGSNGKDALGSVAVDPSGYIFIAGGVESSGLPSSCSWQDTCIDCLPLNNNVDRINGVFGIFNGDGGRVYSSYFGEGTTLITSLVYANNTLFFGGSTNSSTSISTFGSHQENYGGNPYDCFLTKFSLCSTPTQPLITGDTAICENTDAVYEVDLTASCYGASYVWALPTGWTGSSTGTSIQITANNSSGTITVTPYNVCGMAGPPATLYVTVLPTVTAPVISINGNVLSTGSYDFYQWYLNGNPINGATQQSYTTTQQGTYTVQVWDTGTCDVSSAAVTLDVKALQNYSNISVYPNPTKGIFTIETQEAGTAIVSDIQGREIHRCAVAKGKTAISLPAGTANGVYILQYRGEQGRATVRLVVEH